MRRRIDTWMPMVGALLWAGCVGQTGGTTVVFPVAAAGPADAVAGQSLSFSSGGFDFVLTRATLHIGAVYLDESQSVSGGQATGCYLTGTYVAQETASLDVDLLDPTAHRFPAPALGITDPAPLVGQVWLTGGDVNEASDSTPILVLAGTATKAGLSFPFTGTITISTNRRPSTSATGGGPICKARIVTPIPARVALQPTGGLLLRIDPRPLFAGVDLSTLPRDPASGAVVIPDAPGQAAAQSLYGNLHSTALYTFSWTDAL
ncbi:MAG: hypothetical protein JWM82_3493 [Myxococcales bacterium]|nr:hypothetical protein [Myxococcales bacterium]